MESNSSPQSTPPGLVRRLRGHFSSALTSILLGMMPLALLGYFWDRDALFGRRIENAVNGAVVGIVLGAITGFLLRLRSTPATAISKSDSQESAPPPARAE